jgi:hypothetical protein
MGRAVGRRSRTRSARSTSVQRCASLARVLHNQAHDSLCGCSVDAVVAQVMGRYEGAAGLARETVNRLLERLAGHDVERRRPDVVEPDVAVFNRRRIRAPTSCASALEPYPTLSLRGGPAAVSPLSPLAALEEPGSPSTDSRYGSSARSTRAHALVARRSALDVEFVAADVPAFGYRRFTLSASRDRRKRMTMAARIAAGDLCVRVADNGSLDVDFGGRRFSGLFAVEDRGDGGDTYDFDAIPGDPGGVLASVTWRRLRHPSGIQRLEISRIFDVPVGVHEDREQRAEQGIACARHRGAGRAGRARVGRRRPPPQHRPRPPRAPPLPDRAARPERWPRRRSTSPRAR